MKCNYHPDRDAVAHCNCGRALCPECTNKYSIPICDQCVLGSVSEQRQILIKNSVIMVVLFIFGFYIAYDESFFMRLLYGYFMAGIPWGWSILTAITPNIFLFLSWFGWLVYFTFKFILATLIGMFVTPYQIYKVVQGINQAKELEHHISS